MLISVLWQEKINLKPIYILKIWYNMYKTIVNMGSDPAKEMGSDLGC